MEDKQPQKEVCECGFSKGHCKEMGNCEKPQKEDLEKEFEELNGAFMELNSEHKQRGEFVK